MWSIAQGTSWEEKVGLKGESTGRQVRHEPLHGELAKEGDPDQKRPEEGGESCEKKKRWEKVMISFWAPGSPGSRVITQRCEEDPTIIDSSRANAASVHVATVFKLVFCQRWGRIWSLKGFGNFVLWIKRTKSDRICDTGHWLLQPLDKGECCLIWDKSQICWEARLSGSASVPQDLTTHFNSHNIFLDSNGTTISQYMIYPD